MATRRRPKLTAAEPVEPARCEVPECPRPVWADGRCGGHQPAPAEPAED